MQYTRKFLAWKCDTLRRFGGHFFAFLGTTLGSIFIGLVTYAAFIIAILKARDFSAASP